MTLEKLCLRDAEDIESFYVDTTGMRPDFLQLSAGRVDLNARSMDLAGVNVVWVGINGRTYWRDEQQPGTMQFGFTLDAPRPPVVRGREIGRDHAMAWIPGQDMEYLLDGPLSSLEIGVSDELVEELGWTIAGEPLQRLPEGRLGALARTCALAAIHVDPDDRGSVLDWRDSVLECLEWVLEPWTSKAVTSGHEESSRLRYLGMLKRADAYFEHRGFAANFDAGRLAEAIGVPRRTIFHAYRETLGLGPRRYFELKRLHELRRRLRDPSFDHITITSLASDLGFTDLGRMAARYRELFGENPRDTLRGRERQ